MMKKLILLTILSFAVQFLATAQFTSVTYDLERNWFNEGQPLPAEKSMLFKGMLPTETQVVELMILSSKRNNDLYKATWHRTNSNELSLIVPYKLRASEDYDFALNFFDGVSSADRDKIKSDLLGMLDSYIEANISGEKSIKFLKKNKTIIKDMNEMLSTTLSEYRTKKSDWNPVFSKLITLKLEQVENTKLSKDFVKGDTTTTVKIVRDNARANLVADFKAEVAREVAQLLNTEMYVLTNTRFVDNYETETKRNSIALNAGYGGVYLSGDLQDFTYGSSPYLGIAFPLGNSVLGTKFLRNTSVTLGVFTENFEDEKGNKVSGLVVNRPMYLGLDHKLFQFIRVNAGATFLEGINVPEDITFEPTKKVMIRPYIGLSARIDLSIGLGK